MPQPSTPGRLLAALALVLGATLLTPLAALSVDEEPAGPVATATGALVTRVEAGGEAKRRGVMVGDIIVSYRNHPVTGFKELIERIEHYESAGNDIVLITDRQGERKTFVVAPGDLGVHLSDIEVGRPLPVIPPATIARLDFSSLRDAPIDRWYRFLLDGKHVGYEHVRLSLDDGVLEQYSEVGFDGGKLWGLNHFQVTITARVVDGFPVLDKLVFRAPLTGFELRYLGDHEGTQQGLRWGIKIENENERGFIPCKIQDQRLVPTYLENQLGLFMPAQEGACLHLRQIIDGEPRLGDPVGIVVGPVEAVAVGDRRVHARRIEHRFFGYTGNRHWIDGEGVIIRRDYNGAVTELAERDAALAGVDREILQNTRR